MWFMIFMYFMYINHVLHGFHVVNILHARALMAESTGFQACSYESRPQICAPLKKQHL